jgi:hypothetical protein
MSGGGSSLSLTYQVPTIIRKRIQDVVKPFALEAQSNGIDLVLDLNDPSLDEVPYAITDPFRLGQVVVNLLGNAMRYAAEGATQRVAVRAVIAPEPPRYDLLCILGVALTVSASTATLLACHPQLPFQPPSTMATIVTCISAYQVSGAIDETAKRC